MNLRKTSPVWTLIALAACGEPPANLQLPEGAGVPEELVLVLLGQDDPSARTFVGEPPDEVFDAIPVLPPGNVLGGLISEDGGTVVVELVESAETSLSAYAAAMERAGWEKAVYGGMRGGFERSPPLSSGTWCGESRSVRTSTVSRAGAHLARIRYATVEPGPTPCEDASLGARMGVGRFGLTLPSLLPPDDVTVSPEGGGGSSDSVDMEVLVEGALGVEALFEHYARQLDRAGWTQVAMASNEHVAVGRWSAADDMENPTVGVFAVWSLPGEDEYRAWIRLERVR